MTTTTSGQKPMEIVLTRGEECTVGVQRMPVTSVTAAGGGFTWGLYVTDRDEWWEGCGHCEADSGIKPYYGHVYNGVCFQCGGVGVRRIAGGEKGMRAAIRRRIMARTSRLNAAERAAERSRAAAEAYCVAHPNLASDLARERAYGTLGRNVLGDLALALTRAPLSVKQERYAITLLTARAWEEAHATPTLTSVHAGSVGERITLSGTISVWHHLPEVHFERKARALIVVDARNANGDQVLLKMTTAARWAMDAHKGDSVTVQGTVRAHEDGRYGKQTVLIRPSLVG